MIFFHSRPQQVFGYFNEYSLFFLILIVVRNGVCNHIYHVNDHIFMEINMKGKFIIWGNWFFNLSTYAYFIKDKLY